MKLDSYLSLHKFQLYMDERSLHETSLPESDGENLDYTWGNKHRKVLLEQDFISIAITAKKIVNCTSQNKKLSCIKGHHHLGKEATHRMGKMSTTTYLKRVCI